jgi:hypothetical protein
MKYIKNNMITNRIFKLLLTLPILVSLGFTQSIVVGSGANSGGVNTQTGTSYTIVAADQGKLITFSNASAVTVNLPNATGQFGAGWFVDTCNYGVGLVTITPTTALINGAANFTEAQNVCDWIFSDGTNYSASVHTAGGGGGSPTFPVNAQSANYSVLSGDFSACKIITMNSASATTITLLSSAPTTGQCIRIQNIGFGTVTVARNTRTIDGLSTDLKVAKNEGVDIVSDGTNYVTQRGTAGYPNTQYEFTNDRSCNQAFFSNNDQRVLGVYLPYPVTFSNLGVWITTADAGATTYSWGLADSGGTIRAHVATRTLNSTGSVDQAIVEGTITLPAGKYYFAFTASGTDVAQIGASCSTYLSFAQPSDVSTTTSGGNVANLIAPADDWTPVGQVPFLKLH